MPRTQLIWTSIALLTTLGLVACGETAGPATGDTPPLEDDLVPLTPGGKLDTGYLSNLAAELEGTFSSQLVVDVSDRSLEEQRRELARLEEGGWAVQQLVDQQIKFAKNQINAAALHINLSSSEVEVSEVSLEDGLIHVRYSTSVETVVTRVELDENDLTLEDVLDSRFGAVIPAETERMHSDVGTACLDDEHQSETPEAYNYFYYFEPEREGCAEAMRGAGIERIDAELRLRNLAPSDTVYPEYDQLVADGRVDVVVFFGAADHGWEPGDWDWGTYQRDIFVRDLRARGFRSTGEADEGELYTRTVDDLVENVTIIGPETLKLLRDDRDGLFTRVVSANEIIFYNGHSFYGSLSVLNSESLYPGRYQIFFMNSCWSYEYYTKQIFRNNATDTDPDGWLLADVVNDTESGWFHNMGAESRILLTNLLAGAETGGRDGDRYYTWNRIIGAMNDYAIDTQSSRGTETHEIYGVSGVRTNRWDPEQPVDPEPNGTLFEGSKEVDIPDNDRTGASDSIVVPSGTGRVDKLTITLEIEHTWIGDLTVTLHHADRYFTLHSRSGGSRDDLSLSTTTDHFAGQSAAGDWTLVVVDSAGADVGKLVSWSIEL